MKPRFIMHIRDDALGRPRSYDELCRLAARYARDRLAGLTLVNQATQLSITLTRDALAAATRAGAPAGLLRTIPVLPSLLTEARYIRSTPDRRRYVSARSTDLRDTRRVHLLVATAEIGGRPLELRFIVRENFGGQGFLDQVTAQRPSVPHRQDGGGAPEAFGGDDVGDTASGAADDHAYGIMADADGPTDAPAGSNVRANASRLGSDWLDTNTDYAKFFDQQVAPAVEVAQHLGVDPALLLGLSAEESSWGRPKAPDNKPNNNYIRNHNPLGLTPGGDKTSGLSFPSFRAAWQAWESMYGPRVAGLGNDAVAFTRNLSYDNRHVYGPTIGGDYRGAYNPEEQGWKSRVSGTIEGVRKRLPRWQGNLDSLP